MGTQPSGSRSGRTILNPYLKPYPGPEDEVEAEAEAEVETKASADTQNEATTTAEPTIPDKDAPGSPPPRNNRISRGRYWNSHPPPHDSPGDIAINAVESRIQDDLAYRAYQASFLASRRVGAASGSGAGPKSLEYLAAGKVVESLRYDPGSGLVALRKCPEVLQEMVLDRLHYVSFRGLQGLVKEAEDDLIAKEAKTDLEEWIIKNELMMRQEQNSTTGLVTLEDNLDIIFPDSTVHGGYREIRRREPPKSNFCFFDQMKPAKIKIQNTIEGYIKTFHESTEGILDGLNWSNIFVGGGIALNTLLRVESAEGDEPPTKRELGGWVTADIDSDIDIYIYGLKNPREANKRIKHIFEVWSKNVDAAATASGKTEMPEKLLIRNSKTVNFLSDYPHRRIQVILKLNTSPTDILLNFDLDPCAIGFNGKEVLMLPRCCRALETGYSVFTTDLVEGHHLGDRRETQLPRVYKYADRGFGIRIIPQYLSTLKARDLRQWHNDNYRYYNRQRQDQSRTKFKELPLEAATLAETEKNKIATGKKLLSMVAFFEDDLVHRMWVGPTAMSKYKDEWEDEYREEEQEETKLEVNMSHFDGRRQYGGSGPHGRNGLGGFELFYRHASLWVKEKEGLLDIERNTFMSPTYEPHGYSDLPGYAWDDDFRAKAYANEIDNYNRYIYELLQGNTDDFGYDRSAHHGYYSRRTERLCCGSDIDAILERELAIPVYIPKKFEDYANNIVKGVLREQGIVEPSGNDFELLIPVHEEGMGPGLIPERQREADNWVFWLIGPSVSWARLDRRIDEIFEVLWTFYNISMVDHASSIYNASDGHFAWATLLKHHLDRRAPRILSETKAGTEKPDEKKTFTWPDEREQQLFRAWVRDEPYGIDTNMAGYQQELGHRKYRSEDNEYIPEEKYYWRKDYEKGGLEEWLAWGDFMSEQVEEAEEARVENVEVRGEKRKRMSTGTQTPPAKKLEGEDEEGGD